MKTRLSFHLIMILSLLLVALPAHAVQTGTIAHVTPPVSVTPEELLQFTASGHALGFTADGMYAATSSHALHVDFVGANPVHPQADSSNLGQAHDNPTLGTNAVGSVASLNRVSYPDVWSGITLTYTAEAGCIFTTTYTLAPEADPADIRLRYNAPLSLNKDGTLGIAFETGAMTESAPVAWQDINSQRVPVDVSFQVIGQTVTFALGAYDPRYALMIDPTLVWNTFLGQSGEDRGTAIAVDGSGNLYVTGVSYAPWGEPVRAFGGGSSDAFVARLDPTGALTWNTFLGGSGTDYGYGIALDGSGNVYVTGDSTATWGSPMRAYTSGSDAFVAKVDFNGARTWNTFLGGSGHDYGRGIAVGGGNVYVVGYSTATWTCAVMCTVRPYVGSYDAFAAKLDTYGNLYTVTFLGDSGTDYGYGIAVDGSLNVYVTGYSNASWGSPLAAYTAGWDAFATKLSSSGEVTWNTFLGGDGFDFGYGIAVDGSGNSYVAGYSNASWGSPLRAYTSGYDVFAVKLNTSGGVTWSTFLGGSGEDRGYGIAVDGSGNVSVTGYSTGTWSCFPTTCTVRTYIEGNDAFAAELTSAGALTWNTFLGGSGTDQGSGIATDGSNVYVAGFSDYSWSCSPTACTVRAYGGGWDAFAAKLDSSGGLTWNTFQGAKGEDDGFGITVDGSGNIYVTGASDYTWGSPVRAYTGGFDAFVARLDSSGALVWSTFLGDSGVDYGYGIALDGNGNVCITGWSSLNWGIPQRSYTGGPDGFAAKLSASTGALIWNTFLGGSGSDLGYGIAVDAGRNIYVTGYSTSTWGSPLHAYTSSWDAFAVRLTSDGALTWSTFLGGSGNDMGIAIAIDGSNVYLAGYSDATWGSPQRAYTASFDAFAARLNASTGALTWNTFLGGSATDEGRGIAVDASGNPIVIGLSGDTWGSPQRAYSGGADTFVAKLNPSTGALTWSTFLGGIGYDYGYGIDVDWDGNFVVTGRSYYTWGSPARAYVGGSDVFLAKLNASSGALTWNTFLGGSGNEDGLAIVVDGTGSAYVTGWSDATWGSPVRAYSGGMDAFVARLDLDPPVVVSSLRKDPNPTNAASVDFTVTFSEPVTGVDNGDFSLTTTGVSGASVTGVSGSGRVYTVTVGTGSNIGTIRLDVPVSATIADLFSNQLAGLPFTTGQTYTVRILRIHLPLVFK